MEFISDWPRAFHSAEVLGEWVDLMVAVVNIGTFRGDFNIYFNVCVMLFRSWVLFDFFGAFSRTQSNTEKENIFTSNILHQKIFYNETIGV